MTAIRDISRRKSAEHELKIILNTAANSMWVIDADYYVKKANTTMTKMLDMNEDEIVGQKCYNVFSGHPCHTQDCPLQLLKTKKLEVCKFKTEMVRKDGKSILVIIAANPIYNQNGEFIGVTEDVNDITEYKIITDKMNATLQKLSTNEKLLKEANQQLEIKNKQLLIRETTAINNENRYHLLSENISDVIWIYNLSGNKFTYISPSVKQFRGYTPEEALKLTFIESLVPESGEKILKEIPLRLKKFLSGEGKEIYRDELRQARKDGSVFWVEIITKVRFAEDKTVEIIGVSRDINTRKLAEFELKKFNVAVTQSPAMIAISDTNGNLEYINPKFTKLTGYTMQEVIGKNPRFLKSGYLPPEIYQELWDTISSGNTWKGEFFNTKKNNEQYWEIASISPIFDEDGKIVNFIKVSEDITKIKDKEKELEKALVKAKESDKLKSAFLANMSHEIRTPMNGILGFSSLLEDADFSQEEKAVFIKKINKSGQRMLSTVNDIIDISKIESGQMEITNTKTHVHKILSEVYSFLEPDSASKGIELKLLLPEEDKELVIITDNNKLYGVLLNLVKNAIKYTEKGSITFGYHSKPTSKHVCLDFFVKDTGIGIPINQQNSIFRRFEQADISDSKTADGSGLGLAISKAYVHMLGGDIWVSSEEDNGSTFNFSISCKKPN